MLDQERLLTTSSLSLQLLASRLAICRLAPDGEPPERHTDEALFSLTWSADELTVICDADRAPPNARVRSGYRAWKVKGPLDFALTGILAGLTDALAKAGVPVFAVSTFDTDYLLVHEDHVDAARVALSAAGHSLECCT